MTPEQMSDIHTRAFTHERGWSAQEFGTLLDTAYTHAFFTNGGFAVTRTLAGETELLTLAVDPKMHRRGTGRALIADWLSNSRVEAQTAFLEVAADNHAAIALYKQMSFTVSGTRRGYYARAGEPAVDALLMTRALTQG